MEAIWNELTLERVAAKTVAQALMENEIPLPAGREAQRVLHVEGTAQIQRARCAIGRVVGEGTVDLQILCLPPEGGAPFGMRTAAGYRHDIPMEGVEEGMRATVTPQLQEIQCRLENGRLRLSGVVELSAVVQQSDRMRVLSGVNGAQNLQTLRKELHVEREIPLGMTTMRLREEIPAADADTVLLQSGAAQVRGMEMAQEGMSVEGTLSVTVLCAAPQGQMNQIVQHISFEELVPVQGDRALYDIEDLQADIRVRDITVTPAGEESGALDVEAVLDIYAYGREQEQVSALADAYSPAGDFTCVQQQVERMRSLGRVRKKCSFRESVAIPEDMPEAYRSVYAAARPVVIGVSDAEGRLGVDGVLFASIIFQTDEGEIFGFEEEVPFQCVLDAPFQEDAAATARALHAQVSGSGRMLDVTFTLEVEANLQTLEQDQIAVDATACEPARQPQGILIYLANEGETFWDVGKRFGLTVDQVKDWNPGMQEPLQEGQQMVLLSAGR